MDHRPQRRRLGRADESEHGIDIISLSWGITSHEGGGSDGEDMHSRILNEAMEAGVVVSVAAGNDGPDNDGLSGMGSSSSPSRSGPPTTRTPSTVRTTPLPAILPADRVATTETATRSTNSSPR